MLLHSAAKLNFRFVVVTPQFFSNPFYGSRIAQLHLVKIQSLTLLLDQT